MKKSKRIFSIVFIVLLLIMSGTVLSLYDNVRDNAPKNEELAHIISDDLQYFTIAMAKQLDPSYEPLIINESVDEATRQAIKERFNQQIAQLSYEIKMDKDFVYTFTNTVTNQKIMEHTDKIKEEDDKTKYNLYSYLKYDENGNLISEGDLNIDEFKQFNSKEMLWSLIDGDVDYEYSGYDIDSMIDLNNVTINPPKNLEVTYVIPEIPVEQGRLSYYVNAWESYNYFSLFSLLGCSAILALFFAFYPIKIVEEVNPFLSVKKWKAGINIVLLILAISFGGMGCMIVCGYTLNGFLMESLANYGIPYLDMIIMVINLGIWMITLLAISLGLFQIKYIFARGVGRYLKEDTLTGSLIRYIKRKLDKIAEIDLSKPQHQIIMKYILINTVIVIIMITFWGFGYILAIIYGFVTFFWVKDKVQKMQKDYDKLLNATKELGKGHFDVEIDGDVGIFNALNEEFKNIKVGFEKAVKEETKSQNMKNELVSNVSHDLKTPLTCIKNYIVLLQDDSLPEETRHEYLDNLNQYSNRLTKLIEDLFEVSKVNSGNIKLELMDLNIVALIEQAHAECSDILETRNLTVITNYPHNEMILSLDGDKTYRVFENLFTNISKYALPNSRVYIDIEEKEDSYVIAFKNISQEQMNFSSQEIIERFVRGDKSRHESGSGLGLAIAKSFVEAQGGTFTIDIDGDLFKAVIEFKKIA